MENKSKEGRENGGENDTNDTKKGENSQAADNEVAKKCEEERDTENGVAPNASDVIETDGCQGPEAVSGAKITSEKPSGTVSPGNSSAQPMDTEFEKNTRGMETKADEGVADPGTTQVETSGMVQTEDGNVPQTAADSSTELKGNKEIEEPSIKTPDAPTDQPIKRNKMDDSASNGTQEPLPGSVEPKAKLDHDHESSREGSEKTDEEKEGKPKITDSSSEPKETKPKTVVQGEGLDPNHEGAARERSGKTDEEKEGKPKITDSSSEPKETKPKTVELEAGPGPDTDGSLRDGSQTTDKGGKDELHSIASHEGSGETDEEEGGKPQIADLSTAPPEGSGETDEEENGEPQIADHSTAPHEDSAKTYYGESGELQTTVSSSKLKETEPETVVQGEGLDPNHEGVARERSGKTDEEKEGKPKITDSSSEPKETKPKTVHRNPTTNPPTPDSGSKDPNDNEGARERKTNDKSQEEKRATENEANEQKVNKKDAAATKEDGTTKQIVNEEKVEHVSEERPVSISVCTSAYEFNVQGLVSFLKDLMKDHPELIKEVKVHALPYNNLDHYTFPEENPVDVMLLCHSINNRRFAITDVMDALYDEYLPYCQSVIGKNKMGVIVHDFDDMRETIQLSRMGSFRYKQPKAFKTTSLQITCGHIEKKEQVFKQMQKADRNKLLEFLKNASNFPEEMTEQVTESQSLYTKGKNLIATCQKEASSYIRRTIGESFASMGRSQDSTSKESSVDPSTFRNAKAQDGKTKRMANERQPSSQPAKRACTSGDSHQTPQACRDESNRNPPRDASLIGQQRPGTSIAPAAAHTIDSPGQQSMASERTVTSAQQRSSPHRILISVCSSAYEHNVKGFVSKLTEVQAGQPHNIADVRFRSLPYNDIDSFRFHSNDPVDVMVLCHSVQNRGFSITNVLNAMYEKYLQYCHDVIGKKKLAVIVHDFSDCKPKTLEVRMESFRRSQPLTFELVDTVIVCGSLEKPGKIEMRDEDMTRLITFFERATFEPKENTAEKRSFVGRIKGKFGI